MRPAAALANTAPGHTARERGAAVVSALIIVAIVAALTTSLFQRQTEMIGDELADAPVDLREEVAVRRVERVVEIEHPALDVIKPGGWRLRRHGVLLGAFRLRLSINVPAPCSVNRRAVP